MWVVSEERDQCVTHCESNQDQTDPQRQAISLHEDTYDRDNQVGTAISANIDYVLIIPAEHSCNFPFAIINNAAHTRYDHL